MPKNPALKPNIQHKNATNAVTPGGRTAYSIQAKQAKPSDATYRPPSAIPQPPSLVGCSERKERDTVEAEPLLAQSMHINTITVAHRQEQWFRSSECPQ